MPEEKMADIMREFVKAMAAGDAEKTVSYLTEDAISVTPFGTYKGKEAIKQNVAAMAKNMKDMGVREVGNRIISEGDKAFFEHMLSGTFRGKKYEMLAMCAYEFSGDKIKNIRSVYDRLLVAQQVVTGWPAKPLVNMVVRQTEKGMK